MSLLFRRREPFHIERGDAILMLNKLSNESVDLVVTDPAYESLEKHRKVGTTTRLKKSKSSSNEWFPIFPNARMGELFHALYRVLKRNTHLYMHCDCETMFFVKPIAEQVGFKFWKALVWNKECIGMGYHYRAQHEFILFFEKGKRKLNNLSIPDILTAKRIVHGYPTEKPVSIASTLIEQSTRRGELVLDPFMGSATVGVACAELGRQFLGFDIADDAMRVAESRLFP